MNKEEKSEGSTEGTSDEDSSSDEIDESDDSSKKYIDQKRKGKKCLDKELRQPPQEPVSLTLDIIKGGLSGLAQNLVNMKYTYSKLNVPNKQIKDIDILSDFIHLRFLDLSGNCISSLKPLGSLEFLEVLNVANNNIQSASDLPMLKHLKILDLSENKLESLSGFLPNFITHLELRGNKLENLEGVTSYIFPNITHLNLCGNKLTTLKHLQLPRLEKLYVSENCLVSLGGLHRCPMLKSLHARSNNISKLKDFPSLAKLEYVNLRQNLIKRFTETYYLIHSPNIGVLILLDNPITKSSQYKMNLIEVNPNLQRLDKMKILETELEDGRQMFQSRLRGLLPPISDDPLVLTPPQTPLPINDQLMQGFSNNSVRQDTATDLGPPPNTPYDSRPGTEKTNYGSDYDNNDKKRTSTHSMKKLIKCVQSKYPQ